MSSKALIVRSAAVEKVSAAKAHGPKPHAKKHAPKLPGPHDEKGHGPGKKKGGAGKHLRRCYEHLARVDALLGMGTSDARLGRGVERARELVLQQLRSAAGLGEPGRSEGMKAAAEMARATEHIAFAAVVEHAAERIPWKGPLQEAFDREYRELTEEAQEGTKRKEPKAVRDEHEDAQAEIAELVKTLAREADKARDRENYACAMECMRAAESLAAAARHLTHLRRELQANV